MKDKSLWTPIDYLEKMCLIGKYNNLKPAEMAVVQMQAELLVNIAAF